MDKESGIGKLLTSEQEAKQIIEKAKTERNELQRQSKAEAEQEIKEYKEKKEREFSSLKEDHDLENYTRKLEKQTTEEKKTINLKAGQKKGHVIELLLNFVKEVKLDFALHK
eukprot:TRINITY_DN2407_c0_g1_i1.p1 TRINITY_DN2407_c0_g1~~TRINITY_DN2407_c0_g1_i1.p1  ORF type:complete len:112 (-),score=47.58 TRINITY_DN2407_c0_g1_i1:72-407(-)